MKKYLSRILCLLMALALVFCFAACVSDKDSKEAEKGETESSVAGTYMLDSMEYEGEKMTAEDLENAGYVLEDFFIILNKDGTGTLCTDGSAEELEWNEDEIIDPATDEAYPYTLKGDKLTVEIEGAEMTFKKTSKKLTVPEKEEEEEEKPEVSATTYVIYAATSDGVTLSGADLIAAGMTTANTYITLNSDGTALFAFLGEENTMGWNSVGMWSASDPTDVATMSIDGDVLAITSDDFSMYFVKEGSSQTPDLPANSTTTGSIAGRYELYGLSDGTATYEGASLLLIVQALELETLDDYMYLELNEDGTGKLVPLGIEGPLEYNQTHLWFEGDSSNLISYTFENGKLTFSMEGYTYVFIRK